MCQYSIERVRDGILHFSPAILQTRLWWSCVNRLLSIPIPDWCQTAGVPLDEAGLQHQLTRRLQKTLAELLGRPWQPAADGDCYLARLWTCVNYHGARLASAGIASLDDLLDRLEVGDVGYSRTQSNLVVDICFAMALELGEEAAARRFERDCMPLLRFVARKVAGPAGVERIENFLAELILPREERPPRIASYVGKTSLNSWLTVVTTNYCHSLHRSNRETQLPELVEAVQPQLEVLQADERNCQDLLQPMFRAAVAEVPEEDRLLLKLLVLDDVPQKDVARVLGIHSGNVTRRRQRAAERVWQELQSAAGRTSRPGTVKQCLDLVLAGESRELRMTLGTVLADALPSESQSQVEDLA